MQRVTASPPSMPSPAQGSMRIPLMDRSLYFKGLLLLVAKDRVVGDEERALMMDIGRIFSFEKRFCQEVIDDILTNEHVVDEPPVFADPEIARCFIRDGLRLSMSDGQMHEVEWTWLQSVGDHNGLEPGWCDALLRSAKENEGSQLGDQLEARSFVWE